jgi:hypothetical protein
MAGNYARAMENLALARAKRPWMPRRWRTEAESDVIARLVWQAANYADRRGIPLECSIRTLGRRLGISHTWVRRLLARHRSSPGELQRVTWRSGMVTMLDFEKEHARSEEQRAMGLLRRDRRPGI